MQNFDESPFVLAPQQERSRVTLQRIVRAAADVIAEKGSQGFSMEDIAARSGLSIGNIYRRFRGKDDLLRALKTDATSRIDTAVATRVTGKRYADFDELASAYAQSTAQAFAKDEALHRYLFSQSIQMPALGEIGRAGRLRIFDTYKAHLLPLLNRVPAGRAELLAFVSFQIISSALISKARGDVANLNELSWSAAAKEFANAAACYLRANAK